MDNRDGVKSFNIIDLTAFLSETLLDVLSMSGSICYRKKIKEINEDVIAYAILNIDTESIDIVRKMGFQNSFISNCSNKINDESKSSGKNGLKNIDKITMKQSVNECLIDATNISITLNYKFVTPCTLLYALARKKYIDIDSNFIAKSLNIPNEKSTDIYSSEFLNNKESDEDNPLINLQADESYIPRDNITEQIIRIFYKNTKRNVLLVGNDGIGKKSTKYLLANISDGNDSIFKGSIIYDVDLSKPDYLERIYNIKKISSVLNNKNKVVIYLENLESNGSDNRTLKEDYEDLINDILLSPFYAVIPIDFSLYQLMMKNNKNLIKNSEIVFMDEPEADLVKKIVVSYIEREKGVKFENGFSDLAISLAKRYIHDTFLPASAISLIDDSISQSKIKNEDEISISTMKFVLAQKTNIPIEDISLQEIQDLQNLENILEKSVIGQDEAVEAVSKTIKRSRAGLRDPKRPIGSFLFLGPSGTGKTQLAKALANVIYKDESAMIRIDMSEYSETHTVDRLVGAPPGYVGYEEGGQLTNKVLQKPYSLILLDEVEKANPKIFDIFLQVLDDGRLTDGQGKTVDFKNTIIIMTSNIVDEYKLNTFFRVEFLNRIDKIIKFNKLNVDAGKKIVEIFIKDLASRLKDKNITLTVPDESIEFIAKNGISDKYGARPLKRMVEEKIEDPIVEKIIQGDIKSGDNINWNIEE